MPFAPCQLGRLKDVIPAGPASAIPASNFDLFQLIAPSPTAFPSSATFYVDGSRYLDACYFADRIFSPVAFSADSRRMGIDGAREVAGLKLSYVGKPMGQQQSPIYCLLRAPYRRRRRASAFYITRRTELKHRPPNPPQRQSHRYASACSSSSVTGMDCVTRSICDSLFHPHELA
ncbi:hypothetical protein FIBSPDRAFT_851456 [Athelia psychrophila]|uniref:Uncharacterized protein n=1 Tax=Athelia psychrophila TaxID=1759441 RepID=A0A166SHR0_9AGAM|nr:hypothetical protein FIBSPDRAFT_851456 [Fibularhizoctonia sp. CBS 109695]